MTVKENTLKALQIGMVAQIATLAEWPCIGRVHTIVGAYNREA